MKNRWLLLIGLLACACTEKKADDIVLTFDVKKQTTPEAALVYYMTLNEIPLDEQGHAVCTLKNLDGLYANLFYGNEKKQLYLEKGDRVHIRFDGNDFKNTMVFEGDKAPVIDYLNRVTITPLPDEDYALSLEEYCRKLEQKEQEYLKLLKARNLENHGKFVRMEEGRIHYAFGSGLLMYPVGHPFVTQDTSYKPGEEYYAKVKELMVEDEDWVHLKEYRDVVIEGAHLLDPQNREVTDIYEKTVGEMRYIADHFQNEKVKQTLLNELACQYIEQFGIKNITELENVYNTYVKDTVLQAAYRAKYDIWDVSSPGKPSPDFEAVDIEGKTYSLKDFKGKYLYIDLWATWCGPCQRELPALKELEEKFEGKNITFLGLSIDHNKNKWEEKVKSGDLTGVQLLIGRHSTFQKAYNIDGIPRFLLIDKEGKIVNNDMSRPSSEDTERVLNALPGI